MENANYNHPSKFDFSPVCYFKAGSIIRLFDVFLIDTDMQTDRQTKREGKESEL